MEDWAGGGSCFIWWMWFSKAYSAFQSMAALSQCYSVPLRMERSSIDFMMCGSWWDHGIVALRQLHQRLCGGHWINAEEGHQSPKLNYRSTEKQSNEVIRRQTNGSSPPTWIALEIRELEWGLEVGFLYIEISQAFLYLHNNVALVLL
jgi:hypothetical protein